MGTATGNPTWENAPSESTPISAQSLQNIEDAIDLLREDVDQGGGGGTGGGQIVVYRWTGTAWPSIPSSAPAGVKLRYFDSAGDTNATPYTGATWPGVTDLYLVPGV